MGKIKDFYKTKSIKKAFTIYMLACIILALLISLLFSNFFQWTQSGLYKKYQNELEIKTSDGMVIKFEQIDASSREVGISNPTHFNIFDYFTPLDLTIYNAIGILTVAVYPFSFIFCIVVTSVLFYKRQLQKPLALLDSSARSIAENNLDFTIAYGKDDEMGKLCESFENMRRALQNNNEEMWRHMEERKRLNAAFSHDLRTPLTVLKGQIELLIRYAPKMSDEKIVATSEIMLRHIERLELYVKTMRELQRLEDIEIERHPVSMEELRNQLYETGESVCVGKEFSCDYFGNKNLALNIDSAVVHRVFENFLANAARYAKKKIIASIRARDGYLYLTVSDDGIGFAEKDLSNATKPFYKKDGETDNEHFGMGLNICKILCEKHGGYIILNNKNGAVVSAVFGQ